MTRAGIADRARAVVRRAAEPLAGAGGMQAIKAAVAAGLGWFVAADVIGNRDPVFAALAALLTTQVTIWESVSRGAQRVLGVLVGVLVAYGFARLAGIHAWSIALVILVSFLVGRAMRLGAQGSIQVPVSALLVLVFGATIHGYALDRVVDTAIGVVAGLVVSLVIVPHPRLAEAQAQLDAFTEHMSLLLRDVGVALSTSAPIGPTVSCEPSATRVASRTALLDRARRLSEEAAEAARAAQSALTATRWSPAGRHDRPAVDRLRSAVITLVMVERPARGIAKAVAEAPAGWVVPATVARPLRQLLSTVADELPVWAAQVIGGPSVEVSAGEPSRPLEVAKFYHSVLLAGRSRQVDAETAAITAAIALDAHRISQELHAPLRPAPPTRLSWQTLFQP